MRNLMNRIDYALMRTDRIYNPNVFWWVMGGVFIFLAIMGAL